MEYYSHAKLAVAGGVVGAVAGNALYNADWDGAGQWAGGAMDGAGQWAGGAMDGAGEWAGGAMNSAGEFAGDVLVLSPTSMHALAGKYVCMQLVTRDP